MSNVLCFDRSRLLGRRPGAVITETAAEIARRRVLENLKDKGIRNDRIAQAQARAARSVSAGKSISDAVYRALAWARDAVETFPDPAA